MLIQNMATIKTSTKIEGTKEKLFLADIMEKEKDVKLDNLLTVLNFENFDIDKIKVLSVIGDEQKEHVKYGNPDNNELFVLAFRDVKDILEFKVKGHIEDKKFNILMDFKNNRIQIKTNSTKKYSNELIEKF